MMRPTHLNSRLLLPIVLAVTPAACGPSTTPSVAPPPTETTAGSTQTTTSTAPPESESSQDLSPRQVTGCGSPQNMPAWLSHIAVGRGLCVTAPPSKALHIHVGQNLKSREDILTASSAKQIFYALAEVEIPAGEQRVVPAMCGGEGSPLPDGHRVVPGTLLPPEISGRLAVLVTKLTEMERDIAQHAEFARDLENTGDRSRKAKYDEWRQETEKRLRAEVRTLSTLAGLTRRGVIESHKRAVTKAYVAPKRPRPGPP